MTALAAASRRLGRTFAGASQASELPGAARIRRCLAVLFGVYAAVLLITTLSRGDIPSGASILVAFGAIALYMNRGGRFLRDWMPVLVGFLAYGAAGSFARNLKFGVHYLPQLDADRLIGFGTLPTVWLQQHLYHGRTGPLEMATTLLYLSHFFVPIVFAFWLWSSGRGEAFTALMYGLLTACVLAEITFVVAPTAPPWMASEHGLAPPIHHLFRDTLYDLHFSKAAEFIGNPKNYDAVAAMPSLHAAWPIVSLLVACRYALPRPVRLLLGAQFVGVAFAIVYTGEHYVADALVGVGYAVAASWIVRRVMSRTAARASSEERSRILMRVANATRAVRNSESGQTLVEYVLILAFVSIVGIAGLTLIGGEVVGLLSQAVNAFP
jgi:Flp pilus assembly pilin Flp